MSITLDRTTQLNSSQAAEIVAAQFRMIHGKMAEECPGEPGGILIELLRDDLNDCVHQAIEDAKEGPELLISLMVASCCSFMAEATFTALNEPPQTSIERLNELIAALRVELRRWPGVLYGTAE